jgi:hypothetical protein
MGDMDFKIAGTAQGVNAIQLDIKVLCCSSPSPRLCAVLLWVPIHVAPWLSRISGSFARGLCGCV